MPRKPARPTNPTLVKLKRLLRGGEVTIPVASSTQARDLLDGEGRIEVFGETWCLSLEHGSERVGDIDGCDHVFHSSADPRSEAVPHNESLEAISLTEGEAHEAARRSRAVG